MDKTIIIIDKQETSKRATFWDSVVLENNKDFSINRITDMNKVKEYVNSIKEVNNEIPFVIFAHDTDIQFAEKRSTLINACKTKNIALVLYSGGSSGAFTLTNLLLDNLHISILEENIKAFLSEVKNYTLLTEEKLGMLVSIDPKLEALLEPFATYHPLTAFSEDLKAKKSELQGYVNTKLGK